MIKIKLCIRNGVCTPFSINREKTNVPSFISHKGVVYQLHGWSMTTDHHKDHLLYYAIRFDYLYDLMEAEK